MLATSLITVPDERPRMKVVDVANPMHAAVQEGLDLYHATNSLPLLKWPATIPLELREYLNIIYAGNGEVPAPEGDSQPAEPWGDLSYVPRQMWVAYTGGKDSVSAALRAEADGYAPRLYQLIGINRGQGDEPRYAARTALKRGWPLVQERVHVSGAKRGLMELPTKNQVTALFLGARMALDGGQDYCTGWHLSDRQEVQQFDYDYSDGVEAIAAFNAYLGARLPGLRYTQQLHNTTEAWAEIAAGGLLQYIKGCVCPLRYKANLRRRNVERFGWLLSNRCGSCVKCGWEEWALQSLGVLPHNDERLQHGLKWMVRDFQPRMPEASADEIVEFLVPRAASEKYRRNVWPDNPAPADEAEGVPDFWSVDDPLVAVGV